MYRKYRPSETTIDLNQCLEGETIEQKIRRVTNNKEPITDGAPIIFTQRKDGVKPEYDIRTDRFELAVDATDRMTKNHLAKREERHNPKPQNEGNEGGGDTATAA